MSSGSIAKSAMSEKTINSTRPVENGSGLITSAATITSLSAWASSVPVVCSRWNDKRHVEVAVGDLVAQRRHVGRGRHAREVPPGDHAGAADERNDDDRDRAGPDRAARDVALERRDDDAIGDPPEHDRSQHRGEREHRRAGDRRRERRRVRNDEPAQGRDASPPQAAVDCVGHSRLPRPDDPAGYRQSEPSRPPIRRRRSRRREPTITTSLRRCVTRAEVSRRGDPGLAASRSARSTATGMRNYECDHGATTLSGPRGCA